MKKVKVLRVQTTCKCRCTNKSNSLIIRGFWMRYTLDNSGHCIGKLCSWVFAQVAIQPITSQQLKAFRLCRHGEDDLLKHKVNFRRMWHSCWWQTSCSGCFSNCWSVGFPVSRVYRERCQKEKNIQWAEVVWRKLSEGQRRTDRLTECLLLLLISTVKLCHISTLEL